MEKYQNTEVVKAVQVETIEGNKVNHHTVLPDNFVTGNVINVGDWIVVYGIGRATVLTNAEFTHRFRLGESRVPVSKLREIQQMKKTQLDKDVLGDLEDDEVWYGYPSYKAE